MPARAVRSWGPDRPHAAGVACRRAGERDSRRRLFPPRAQGQFECHSGVRCGSGSSLAGNGAIPGSASRKWPGGSAGRVRTVTGARRRRNQLGWEFAGLGGGRLVAGETGNVGCRALSGRVAGLGSGESGWLPGTGELTEGTVGMKRRTNLRSSGAASARGGAVRAGIRGAARPVAGPPVLPAGPHGVSEDQ